MPHDLQTLASRLTSAGCLPVSDIAEWLEPPGRCIEDLMQLLLPLAEVRASAPTSGFAVGAVAQATPSAGLPGALYLGTNLEFPGQPLSCAVHAEQSAVHNAWLHGEEGLQSIALTTAPCGYCRQFLQELTTAHTLELFVANDPPVNGSFTKHSLAELLPAPFGPEQLGIDVRLMRPQEHPLAVEATDPLVAAAAMAARASYAPYTGNLAGVALQTGGGGIVCGRIAENAAFNPTLSPMAGALAAACLNTTSGDTEIIDAVLVERHTSVSQQSHAAALLQSVAGRNLVLRCLRVPHSQ